MQIKLIRPVLFGIVLLFLMMTAGIGSADEVNVELVGSYDVFSPSYYLDSVAISKENAYVIVNNPDITHPVIYSDLERVDIRDPTKPTIKDYVYDIGFAANDIALSDTHAYVADSKGLQIVPLTAFSFENKASYLTDDYASVSGIDVSGNYACLNIGGSSLVILDITNPSSAKYMGRYDTGGYGNVDAVNGIAVSSPYAYLAAPGIGLVVVNINSVSSPKLAGTYNVAGDARDVAVSGKYAYVISNRYASDDYVIDLDIIDITNPSSPKHVSTYFLSDIAGRYGYGYDIAVAGNYAYIADSYNGLVIVDISDPLAPTLAGSYNTAGGAKDVAVSGNNVYLAAGNSGLLVLLTEVQDERPTEGSLVQVQGSPEVYLIENGLKRHFTSPEVFEWNGHSFSDVIQVSSETLASIRDGADISITQTIIDKYHALGGSPIFGQPMGTGELNGEPDSAGNYCSYVNFQNGAIDCFKNGPHAGEAYAIFNPLFTKWGQLGYGAGTLGYPIEAMSEPQNSKYGTSFRYQTFSNGDQRSALEYNINSEKVIEIHGAIFAKWAETGFASGVLGLVTEDENTAAESPFGTVGRYSKFENGTIHWISNKVGENEGNAYRGQSFVTSGDLDAFYTSMGGTGGNLGFPIMDQRTVGVHGYCEFEGGKIEWDDIAGTYKTVITEENTFTPSLNGYKFNNIVGKEYSWDQFCRTYDYNGAQYAATVYLDNNEPYQVPTREYYFFQHHYEDVGKTGTCFGMSASSLVLYNNGFGASDYAKTDTLPSIWHGIGPFVLGYSPETVQEWVEYYQPLQNDKACVDDLSKYKDLKEDNYNTLKLRLLSNDPMVLGFTYGPNNVDNPPGHAVVPYRIIESLDHKIGHIYVYDCNHPYNPDNSLDHIKCIDIDLEKWEVKDYDGCNNMRDVKLVSLTAITEKPEIPDNIVGLDSPLNANLLFSDSSGRHLGYDQGIFKDEIPGTCSLTSYNDQEITSNNYLESYYVPDTSLKTELYGVGSGASNVSMITPNGLIIANVPLSSQSIDEFKVLNEGTGIEFKSENSTTSSVSIMLNVETADQMQIVVANISQIEKSSAITFSNVNGDIIIINIGQLKTFSLNLGQGGANPNSGHSSKNIVVEENSTILIKSVNWNNISNSNITVEHDVGSDSTIEYAESVQMAVSTVSDSKSDGGGGGSSGGSSSSKSSGGGGGGAGSVEDYSNVAVKDVDTQYLRMNANVTYEFTKEGNPVQSVSFYSLKNSGEITSTIEILNNRSKLVNSTPEGSIYKYVNIWVGKAGFATAANIKDAKVRFKVNSSWLEDMGISPADVRLQRYNGSAWEVLPTTLINNTSGYVTFEARTPGFSPFAITAEKVLASSISDNMHTNSTQTEDVGINGAQPEKTPGFGFSMAILIVGVFAGRYVYLKRR